MQTPFFIAGAPKSGTSTLASLLSGHQEIFIPPRKELFFFDFNYEHGLGWYEHLFHNARLDQRIGDATPWYMSWPDVPERIAELFPDARIILLLREPAARAWSHYWHDYSSMFLELNQSPRDYFHCSDDPRRIRSCSLYAKHLSRWLSLFPRQQFLLASTHCLRDEPVHLLNTIASFLGCSQTFEATPTVMNTHRMPGLSPRPGPVGLLSLSQRKLGSQQFSQLAQMLNRHPRLKNLFFRTYSMPLTENVRDWLCPIFQADYDQFVELVGTDVVASSRPVVLG